MKKENVGSVKVIPLGGLEQIGMNITAIEYDDSIVVVDCGLSFPEEEMLGIDLIIPDVTYLKENIDKVKAFVITHGHEDHIGAIPYVLKEVNVPIYATRLTMGLIESKLKEHNMLREVKRKVVRYGQSVTLGDFRVEFIRTNHSIADAAALAIFSPAGILVHTGDFKVDYTPVNGEPIDLQRFAELGKKGVLALCQTANFKLEKEVKALDIKNYLNRYLPRDIAVMSVSQVDERFHSQLNAKSKIYEYRLDTGNVANVFRRKYAYHTFSMPDFDAMRKAAGYFEGKHDFKAFTTAKKNKSTERTIKRINIQYEGTRAYIRIEADDFLHNMARFMIGMLLDAGNGIKKPEDVKRCLDGENVQMSLPAESYGLFLVKVVY